MLTLEQLKEMAPGQIIAQGVAENSPEDIYMTDKDIGRQMNWIATRGNMWDWCIYIGWRDEKSPLELLLNGDKVSLTSNIQKLVPCDHRALGMYRY